MGYQIESLPRAVQTDTPYRINNQFGSSFWTRIHQAHAPLACRRMGFLSRLPISLSKKY